MLALGDDMSGKNYWFKTGSVFTLRGWRGGGLVPFGWKGWLFTILMAGLAIGAWQLAEYASAHHLKQLELSAWSALPAIVLLYMIVGSLKSK
jgi:hypothetical protein